MSKNVLVVEDEGIVSLELQEQLESLGHRVVGVADTGEAAVELATSTRPDLVLMDIRLKGTMDGAEAAARIRKTSNVPIVFLTAYSSDEVLRRAMQSEPYGYLVKPIQEQQLSGALRVVLHKHSQDSIRTQSARRFSSIIRALPHGIILTDHDLKVRYLNVRARRDLGIASTGDVWGRSVFEILPIEEGDFETTLRTVVQTVLEEQGDAFLGRYHLRCAGNSGVAVGETGKDGADTDCAAEPSRALVLEASAFTDSATQLQGILLTISDPRTERLSTPPLWAESDSLDLSTAVDRLGELRSYLELEIIRFSLDEPPVSDHDRGIRDGHIQSNKRILELMFGPEALQEMEKITGA